MMLSHPVLLGFVWSLLVLSTSGQSQISNTDSNKVYAYSYHFQHNGTTNSKEILRSVLGTDPEFGLEADDGKSIVKTFSSPGIRGFFTKGVLPAGPISHNYNNGISSPYSAIRRVVESNLQPPREVATGLLPPISPDISREFPGDFNSVNQIGNLFRNQDDFPKIPPPPPPAFSNNVGNRNVESFSRDTPDGGKIVGQVETFSYNPPPISNSISRIEENSQGYRRNENILNSNREVTGHRTQSYFRQHYRTVTPNLDSGDYNHNSRIDSRNSAGHNNNNQWWNGLSVLGNNNNNINPPNVNPPAPDINNEINRNINEIQNNINRAFGTRLSGFRRQNNQAGLVHNRQNNFGVQNNGNFYNPNQNLNNPLPLNNPVHNNLPFVNVPNMPFTRNHGENHQNLINNNAYSNVPNPGFNVNNNLPNMNIYQNPQAPNNAFNHNPNINMPFNKETEKKVLNLIDNVRSHLGNLQNNNQRINNIGQTWDDDVSRNINHDWSIRQPNLNRREFSNGHSGPSNGPQPADILKKTFDSLMNRNYNIPRNQGGNYRNVDGGGVERVFGVDKVVEGPNSFSRNQHRGYERDFQVNSNRGYNRSNQWSTNTVRRLDAQSSKPDFSKDFIDVFRDDK